MTANVYGGYGRTRRPKPLTPTTGETAVTLNADATVLVGDTIVDGKRVRTTEGYFTENQRYLHVTLAAVGNDPGRDGELWGYLYASGKWAKIQALTFPDAVATPVYAKVEIRGIDRVQVKLVGGAFVGGTSVTAHLACSTF